MRAHHIETTESALSTGSGTAYLMPPPPPPIDAQLGNPAMAHASAVAINNFSPFAIALMEVPPMRESLSVAPRGAVEEASCVGRTGPPPQLFRQPATARAGVALSLLA